MKEKNAGVFLENEGLGRLMAKYAVPCIISLLVAALYNIVDQVFIANASYLGSYGNAANTVVFPLTVWYLRNMRNIKLTGRCFVPDIGVIKRFITLGLCSFLSQISLVAAMAAINNMIRKYGALDPIFGQTEYAQIPMAVVGIVMKFFQIVISIVIGMAAGCIPIVGYNTGAGRNDRVKKLFSMLIVCEAAVGAAALLIADKLPRQLIGIFGASGESVYYTDFAVRAFRIYLCMMIPACVNKAVFIYLQSLGDAVLSTMLSTVREVVFGVGFALLLPRYLGLDGVLWSMPVSDILTLILSAWAIIRTYRRLGGKRLA